MPTGASARSNDDHGPLRVSTHLLARDDRERSPFTWQDGRRLWILDGSANAWVLAELIFEPETCRYLEVRRSVYRWPREAAGALLSRTFASGPARAAAAATGLTAWTTRNTV